jgi:hypothetical protein
MNIKACDFGQVSGYQKDNIVAIETGAVFAPTNNFAIAAYTMRCSGQIYGSKQIGQLMSSF